MDKREAAAPGRPQATALAHLAEILRNLSRRRTTPVFSHAHRLPQALPVRAERLSLAAESLDRLRRFYARGRAVRCFVSKKDRHGRLRKCPVKSFGFGEIMEHQQTHGRRCPYLCVMENCMLPFAKRSNAIRHIDNIHRSTDVDRNLYSNDIPFARNPLEDENMHESSDVTEEEEFEEGLYKSSRIGDTGCSQQPDRGEKHASCIEWARGIHSEAGILPNGDVEYVIYGPDTVIRQLRYISQTSSSVSSLQTDELQAIKALLSLRNCQKGVVFRFANTL